MQNKTLLIAAASLVMTLPCSATAINDLPQISVSGTATLYKPADQVNFTVGVTTENIDVEEALKANNTKMDAVIAALKNSGLTKEEFQTGSFSVYPVYSLPPKNPPPEWRAVITAYRVQNDLYIKTTQIDHAGQLIDAVNKAGADIINDIGFSLKDKEAAQAEVITAATANAMLNAKILSESAHTPLKRILKVSLEQAGPMPHAYRNKMMFAAAEGGASTPIEAAQIEVNATVSMLYEIE
jgi:Uncharacterized conserved protein